MKNVEHQQGPRTENDNDAMQITAENHASWCRGHHDEGEDWCTSRPIEIGDTYLDVTTGNADRRPRLGGLDQLPDTVDLDTAEQIAKAVLELVHEARSDTEPNPPVHAEPVPVRCTRFPCDQAYRRGTHLPNEDGEVVHTTSVAHRYWDLDDTDGQFETKWRVSVAARDDGPWQLRLRIGTLVLWINDTEEIEGLTEGVTRGAMWTMKARLQSAEASL